MKQRDSKTFSREEMKKEKRGEVGERDALNPVDFSHIWTKMEYGASKRRRQHRPADSLQLRIHLPPALLRFPDLSFENGNLGFEGCLVATVSPFLLLSLEILVLGRRERGNGQTDDFLGFELVVLGWWWMRRRGVFGL